MAILNVRLETFLIGTKIHHITHFSQNHVNINYLFAMRSDTIFKMAIVVAILNIQAEKKHFHFGPKIIRCLVVKANVDIIFILNKEAITRF